MGKSSNYALKGIEGEQERLDRGLSEITKALLNDTKTRLESAKGDAEADERAEETI